MFLFLLYKGEDSAEMSVSHVYESHFTEEVIDLGNKQDSNFFQEQQEMASMAVIFSEDIKGPMPGVITRCFLKQLKLVL